MHVTERVPNPQTALGSGAVALGAVTSFEVFAGPGPLGCKNERTEERRTLATGCDTLSKQLALSEQSHCFSRVC